MIGDQVLLKNVYLVEFPSDVDVRNRHEKIAKSLKKSCGIDESKIKRRRDIDSSLFSGTSISLTADLSIEELAAIEDAIAIYPVYTVRVPPITVNTNSVEKSNDNDPYLINSLNITGVKRVHQELNNYGKGVRVRTRLLSRFYNRSIVFHTFIRSI